MKTSLYNPIFINPQAYYVFPQLYNIIPKDDFVETAIFSGMLIVKDLDNQSNKVIFKNTREIDLSSLSGKSIEISQYTDLGSTVLGRWRLPKGGITPSEYYLLLETEDTHYLLLETGNKIILE